MSTSPPGAGERIASRIHRLAGGVLAPERLRSQIAAIRTAQPSRHRAGRAWTVAVAGVAAVAVALVLALTLTPGTAPSGHPTISGAATLALRAPATTAPRVDSTDARFLQAAVGSVRFPSNAYTTGATPTGMRIGRIGGRRTVVVTYGSGAGRVGYAIVDGPPLTLPPTGRHLQVGTIPVTLSTSGGARIITWRAGGHTCVVASRTAPLSRLLAFVGSTA